MFYKDMPLHKITEFYTKRFNICPKITLKFRNTAIFKISVKENNNSNKSLMYEYALNLSLYKTSSAYCKCSGAMWMLTFNRLPRSYFWFPQKWSSYSCFQDLSAYKMSWSHVDWWKFCIHLKSLNFLHFEVVEANGLKIKASRSPSMAWPSYWIHRNLQLGSKFDGGRHTDGNVIS
jgi:hypothetical protein